MRRVNKQGDLKWDFLLILILGLLVVAIVLYFIFGEFFTQEGTDLEVCRQSIILRNTLPEKDIGPWEVSFKDDFPLKCRNAVITIDYKDTARVEKEFGDALVSCWYLYGNGEYGIFPTHNWQAESFCTFCSRFHIDNSVKEYYSQPEHRIDLSRALSSEFKDGYTYYAYLRNVGEEDPFTFVVDGGFSGEAFSMTHSRRVAAGLDAPGFTLPHYFDVEGGDLFILFQNLILAEGRINSANLFYFQQNNAEYDGRKVSAIDLLSNVDSSSFVDNGWFWDGDSSVCSVWDGIPA